jgi:hypothetical protein
MALQLFVGPWPFFSFLILYTPTNGISTLSWWWGLRAPQSYAAGSVATDRATHAGQVKG